MAVIEALPFLTAAEAEEEGSEAREETEEMAMERVSAFLRHPYFRGAVSQASLCVRSSTL